MKLGAIFLSIAMAAMMITGCTGGGTGTSPSPSAAVETPAATAVVETPVSTTAADTPMPTTSAAESPDVVSTASITSDPAVFEKAMSSTGTWIICALADITFDKDLTLDGEFKNGKKDDAGKDIIKRKIALYTQDENRVVTARFTLTAPKLTINSPNASIEHGTFKGDLYINAKGFQLIDNKVEGNVYFASDAIKTAFKMDDKSSVSGKQEVKK